MRTHMRLLSTVWLVCGALACTQFAYSQSYPNKPVRFVVGYPPGGVNDILARAIGQPLSDMLGQSVIVDNRPGANSVIGAELVARAPADGYTLFVSGTPFSINASLYPKLPYDTLRDFAAVTQIATGTFLLVVHPSLPVKSAQELIALAKSRPGQLNFCSSGLGSPPHLMGELLKLTVGIDMVHVPYKGAAPCVTDLLAGQIQLAFEAMAPLLPHVKAGKLRALAVMSDKRTPVLPALPTIAEATGHRGLSAGTWYGIFAPAGTPKDIVGRLNSSITKVLRIPNVNQQLSGQGLEPVMGSPEQLRELLQEEVAKWAKVIKASGASAQ